MPSRSPLGQDLEVPGAEVAFAEFPDPVRDRALSIALLFQHWRLAELDQLVEHGAAIASAFASSAQQLLDRSVDDLELTRIRDDVVSSGVCFRTSNPDEVVYDVTMGPLLGSGEPYSPQAFISFRLRFDHRREALVGSAFDLTYELT